MHKLVRQSDMYQGQCDGCPESISNVRDYTYLDTNWNDTGEHKKQTFTLCLDHA